MRLLQESANGSGSGHLTTNETIIIITVVVGGMLLLLLGVMSFFIWWEWRDGKCRRRRSEGGRHQSLVKLAPDVEADLRKALSDHLPQLATVAKPLPADPPRRQHVSREGLPTSPDKTSKTVRPPPALPSSTAPAEPLTQTAQQQASTTLGPPSAPVADSRSHVAKTIVPDAAPAEVELTAASGGTAVLSPSRLGRLQRPLAARALHFSSQGPSPVESPNAASRQAELTTHMSHSGFSPYSRRRPEGHAIDMASPGLGITTTRLSGATFLSGGGASPRDSIHSGPALNVTRQHSQSAGGPMPVQYSVVNHRAATMGRLSHSSALDDSLSAGDGFLPVASRLPSYAQRRMQRPGSSNGTPPRHPFNTTLAHSPPQFFSPTHPRLGRASIPATLSTSSSNPSIAMVSASGTSIHYLRGSLGSSNRSVTALVEQSASSPTPASLPAEHVSAEAPQQPATAADGLSPLPLWPPVPALFAAPMPPSQPVSSPRGSGRVVVLDGFVRVAMPMDMQSVAVRTMQQASEQAAHDLQFDSTTQQIQSDSEAQHPQAGQRTPDMQTAQEMQARQPQQDRQSWQPAGAQPAGAQPAGAQSAEAQAAAGLVYSATIVQSETVTAIVSPRKPASAPVRIARPAWQNPSTGGASPALGGDQDAGRGPGSHGTADTADGSRYAEGATAGATSRLKGPDVLRSPSLLTAGSDELECASESLMRTAAAVTPKRPDTVHVFNPALRPASKPVVAASTSMTAAAATAAWVDGLQPAPKPSGPSAASASAWVHGERLPDHPESARRSADGTRPGGTASLAARFEALSRPVSRTPSLPRSPAKAAALSSARPSSAGAGSRYATMPDSPGSATRPQAVFGRNPFGPATTQQVASPRSRMSSMARTTSIDGAVQLARHSEIRPRPDSPSHSDEDIGLPMPPARGPR